MRAAHHRRSVLTRRIRLFVAATIANGLEIGDAVKDAQEYTWQTLKAAFRPGMGQHIPDRQFWAREDDSAGDGGGSS